MPHLPIDPVELPKQAERMKAIDSAQIEMERAVAADVNRSALTKCIPAAADSEIAKGAEV